MAILQEEVLLEFSSREARKNEAYTPVKNITRQNGPAAFPKQADQAQVEDKRVSGFSRSKPQRDKLAALMAYRKAKGLCYKCGNKWWPQHHCS